MARREWLTLTAFILHPVPLALLLLLVGYGLALVIPWFTPLGGPVVGLLLLPFGFGLLLHLSVRFAVGAGLWEESREEQAANRMVLRAAITFELLATAGILILWFLIFPALFWSLAGRWPWILLPAAAYLFFLGGKVRRIVRETREKLQVLRRERAELEREREAANAPAA